MPACIPLSSADVYLLCTTAIEPPTFVPCTPENANTLRYSIRVRNAGADLTIPLPLNGLQPTDGPVIRHLLAFLSSRAFYRFRVSPVAHVTIRTILSALWAFWSDLHGIKPTAYEEFCGRLQALMPATQPEGGDMTNEMRDFILWVEREVGRFTLKYRPIDEEEILDAVQQLHRRRVVLTVEVTADPLNADGGEDTHQYGVVPMKHRVKGTSKLLHRDYFLPPWFDCTAVEELPGSGGMGIQTV